MMIEEMKYADRLTDVQIAMARWWSRSGSTVEHLVSDGLKQGSLSLKELITLFNKVGSQKLFPTFPLEAIKLFEKKGFTKRFMNLSLLPNLDTN